MILIRSKIVSGRRGKRGRPVLAWGGACTAVLAVTGGAVAAAGCGNSSAGRASVATRPAADSSPEAGMPAPAAAPSARPKPAPVVAFGTFTGRRPSQIYISADGGNIVTGLRWRSWTASGATGQGTSGIQNCVPDCAQGTVRYVPTTITLSVPANGRFTVLTETRDGRVTVLRWPAQWPLGGAASPVPASVPSPASLS